MGLAAAVIGSSILSSGCIQTSPTVQNRHDAIVSELEAQVSSLEDERSTYEGARGELEILGSKYETSQSELTDLKVKYDRLARSVAESENDPINYINEIDRRYFDIVDIKGIYFSCSGTSINMVAQDGDADGMGRIEMPRNNPDGSLTTFMYMDSEGEKSKMKLTLKRSNVRTYDLIVEEVVNGNTESRIYRGIKAMESLPKEKQSFEGLGGGFF